MGPERAGLFGEKNIMSLSGIEPQFFGHPAHTLDSTGYTCRLYDYTRTLLTTRVDSTDYTCTGSRSKYSVFTLSVFCLVVQIGLKWLGFEDDNHMHLLPNSGTCGAIPRRPRMSRIEMRI